jgi:hypothetical protein
MVAGLADSEAVGAAGGGGGGGGGAGAFFLPQALSNIIVPSATTSMNHFILTCVT